MKEYSKQQRQQILRQIIAETGVGDQSHLLNELRKHGMTATQATISRDLHEMGVVKICVQSGVYKYEILEQSAETVIWDRLKIFFQNFVVDVRSTGSLVVIKTSPGNASGVASQIDHLKKESILGTVAGDDTVLVVVDTDKNRKRLEEDFRRLLMGVEIA